MTITVYTKPICPQCKATLRKADQLGLDVEVVDVATDPGQAERLRAEGFTAMPVVKTGDQQWTGYRPDRLQELAD